MHLDHVIVDNLLVDGLVQGLDVSRDLVLKSSQQLTQHIRGHKLFAAPLTSAFLEISHELNGEKPDIACHSKVPPQNSQWVVYGEKCEMTEKDDFLIILLLQATLLSRDLTRFLSRPSTTER